MNLISENVGADKIERVLGIYTKLINGSIVSKSAVYDRQRAQTATDNKMIIQWRGKARYLLARRRLRMSGG